MAKRTGGDLIAEFLVNEDIEYVFGICGHGNVGLLDSLYKVSDKVKLVSPRHEQAAVHMADGYFRVKHKPAATLTSTGPGSTNQVMGLALAQTDSSAIFSMTANVPTSQFNRSPFQELNQNSQADFNSILKPVVKRSFQPTRTEMLPLALRQAADTMTSGRPGPVNVDMPYNLFMEETDAELEAPSRGYLKRRSGASEADIQKVTDMILNAERPAFFVGHGVTLSEASKELTELATRLSIPVISSPNGMGTLDMRNELALGFIGRNGAYAANQAGRHADVIIAVGARFDDRSSSAWKPGYSWNFPHTKLIHVDVDNAELGRNYVPDVGILADAKTFLQQVLGEVAKRNNVETGPRLGAWIDDIRDWRAQWDKYIAPGFETHASPIRPERIVADCRKVLPDDAIISLDSGVHHNWFMQFWEARQPQTMLNTWGFSGMGFGPCAVLGAKLAEPDKVCVSISGDGGFTMVPYILCTAVEYNIPVVWVVWNNFAWGAIRDLQYGFFDGREIGTGFYQGEGENKQKYNPDFAMWAKAAGVNGYTVTRSEDFAGVLEEAVKSNKPCLIDVHVDAEIRPPGVGTWELPPIPHKEPIFGKPWTPEDK